MCTTGVRQVGTRDNALSGHAVLLAVGDCLALGVLAAHRAGAWPSTSWSRRPVAC
jgi:hypothetical protein